MFERRLGVSLNTGFLFSHVMLMKLFPYPRMFFLPAIGGPQRARGSVIGSINDVEFGIAFLNATVTDSPNSDTRIIHARITNVPRSLGKSLCLQKLLISLFLKTYIFLFHLLLKFLEDATTT